MANSRRNMDLMDCRQLLPLDEAMQTRQQHADEMLVTALNGRDYQGDKMWYAVVHALERGANPDMRDEGGTPMLMRAFMYKNSGAIYNLLQYGANPEALCPNGCSIFDMVAEAAGNKDASFENRCFFFPNGSHTATSYGYRHGAAESGAISMHIPSWECADLARYWVPALSYAIERRWIADRIAEGGLTAQEVLEDPLRLMRWAELGEMHKEKFYPVTLVEDIFKRHYWASTDDMLKAYEALPEAFHTLDTVTILRETAAIPVSMGSIVQARGARMRAK